MRMAPFGSVVLLPALALVLLAARCGDGGRTELSGGDVVGDSIVALNYQLTSENYRRWLQAQDALDTLEVDASVRLNTRRLTEDDVDRAIESLEGQPRVRAAIESAGFSVRDYVLTTIALAQSWDAVNRRDVRFTGVPAENVEFLRQRAETEAIVRSRPRARFVDDDTDTDSEDSERRGRRRGNRNDKDSDSDS